MECLTRILVRQRKEKLLRLKETESEEFMGKGAVVQGNLQCSGRKGRAER